MKFFIVDVFGKEKYSGNQLAVVVLNESISKEKMQRIANEFHFSETTFISLHESGKDGYKVNIFTPESEVPFAGHPTLGTAFVIKNELDKSNQTKLILDLKVGKIPVTFDTVNDLFWMKQIEPSFGQVHNPEDIAYVINVKVEDIDTLFPVQDISTGLEFTIIPLKNLDAIKAASTNITKYKSYFSDRGQNPLFLFCHQTYEKENDFNCRMFAEAFGIPEDPATGSANGCFAAYLLKNNYLHSNQIDIRVEQGYEIGRKSLLYLRSSVVNGKYDINVGGKVIKVAQGELV
jgi:trans-2,3-dihydro-3-hydroxyanthranilate isomerase